MAMREEASVTRLRETIHHLGKSVEQVAKDLNLGRRTLYNYVYGKVVVPEELRPGFATYLGCTQEFLFPHPSQWLSDMSKEDQALAPLQKDVSPKAFLKQLHESSTVPTISPEVISQGILLAIQELERHHMDIDASRRLFLRTLGTVPALLSAYSTSSLVSPFLEGQEPIRFFEQELATRWNTYHTGGTTRAFHGFHTILQGFENALHATEARQTPRQQALAVLCTGYQLEGSLYRDRMNYEEAHSSYAHAFQIAQELDDAELKASALARRGVTCIQQNQPQDAIAYLQEASLSMKRAPTLPYLTGYIFQALSEAHALAEQPYESEQGIDQARHALEGRGQAEERSHCEANTTSVTAQRGVNTVHLRDFASAIPLLEEGLVSYNPSFVRGRARLLAQKAQAYYHLGLVDRCCRDATEAWMLACAAGSNKICTRLRKLQVDVLLSSWKREPSVVDLSWVMGTFS